MEKSKIMLNLKSEQENQAIKGAFSLTLSTIIIKILGLIYKLPLSNILGDEGMGYFNTAYTAYAFFYIICTAGVPKAIMMIITEEDAKKNTGYINRIIKVSFMLFLVLGIVITIVFVLFSPIIAKIIGNSKSRLTMVAIAPSIIFISLSGVLRGLLSAKMSFLDISISQIIEGVGKLAFGLIFAILGKMSNLPLEVISALTILGVTLGSIFSFIHLFICAKSRLSLDKTGQSSISESKLVIKRIFRISIPITLSAAVMSLTNLIDLGLIMRSLLTLGYNENEVAAFFGNYTTLAVPMFNLAISLITPISVTFMPILTKTRIEKDSIRIKETQESQIELTAFVAAPLTLGLMIFSDEILSLLFKNSRIDIGAILLILLSPAIIFSSLLIVLNTILESAGYFKAPIISMLLGGLAKFLVSFLLIRNPHFGISGAPIGTVVSYAVALMSSLVIHHRKLGKGLPLLSKNIKPYLASIISILLAKYVYYPLHSMFGKTLSLLFAIFLAGTMYFCISLLLGTIKTKSKNLLAYSTNFKK